MKRVGDPVRDIGGAAVFLASDDTRYLTGSMIFADGGAFLTTPIIETSVPAA
jgi:NAD(P)-dependent dehydrogenase (short-subunit alcohol dehydrogenase family)